MAERKKIGLLFSYSEGWIGGTYYFINLIHALNQLHDSVKPEVLIVTDDAQTRAMAQETGYPYLSFLQGHFKYSLAERCINKLCRAMGGKNVINKGYSEIELPVLLGYYETLSYYHCKRKLYWIPDLQDCYYPQYLGTDVAVNRKKQHINLAYKKTELVFSSEASKADFEEFYPNSVCKKYVVPFAVTLPMLDQKDYDSVHTKYKLPEAYFICPNQFWSHKNHITVIKAIEYLKGKNILRHVVFTGNESTGGGNYAWELKDYVEKNDLSKLVHFLGFIDRNEQLLLMKNSVAVIQPSLFEGWSTVIEDAKALNKCVIASDLAVHHEQLCESAEFFTPDDFGQLAVIMNKTFADKPSSLDYNTNIKKYADCFLQLLN